jgi:hypothetical protein
VILKLTLAVLALAMLPASRLTPSGDALLCRLPDHLGLLPAVMKADKRNAVCSCGVWHLD